MYSSGEPTPAESAWILEKASTETNASQKILARGEAVQANEAVVVVHRATHKPLFLDAAAVDSTDFGPEFEVSCELVGGNRKINAMHRESQGIAIGETSKRPEFPGNRWIIK